ncbi:unnamed protein product [Lactuca saligna]|uniref:Histone-lysine N-methyltransferase n=1 Tax=Lactuca saligna TaxID=75948 RepID=A0AA36DVX2_LACSI|nr:unnamed protein product [Lactuca saligna]
MASPQRSSKASEPRAPNPNDPKISKAFSAMECLGISREVVKPVLKNLLKLYGGSWELIEEDNYRTLADAIFESFDDKKKSKAVMVESEDQASSARENGNKVKESKSNSNSNPNRKAHNSNMEGSSVDARLDAQRVSSSSGIQRKRHQNNESGDHNATNKRLIHKINDITRGTERLKISLIDEIGIDLPKFGYIPENTSYQDAYVPFTLARIADENCCFKCNGDCLSSRVPCACSRETGGEFAYTSQGLLKDEFLGACISMYQEPHNHHHFYCQDCPLERAKNVKNPEPCKGHLVRKFIKECWRKCGCSMECGNRVVQRGITCKLQVFAMEDKGWGLRTLENLPKGSFVCEYVGEILTNMELYERNKKTRINERHTYPVSLDSDWGSEQILKDEEALCLDATNYGNVARFINHRCFDSNLIEIPVEVETPDHHYYHIAFFTKRNVNAYEELTWDYQIDFEDDGHPIKAFKCQCGSSYCRDVRREVGTKVKELGVKRRKSGTSRVN